MVRKLGPLTLVAAFLLIAALVAGCGGGDEQTTTTTAPAAAAASGANAPAPEVANAQQALIGTKLEPTDTMPAAVGDALKAQQPLVVLFYVPGATDDLAVRGAFDRLQPKHEDTLFLKYDYRDPQAYGDLASLLAVDYPPQLVFVDGDGVIKQVLGGYVDEGTINQQLVNIAAAG